MPCHRGLVSRRWNVCCPSRGGPKLMSPCQVSGLISVPAPSSKTGFRCRYARRLVSTSPSSTTVNGPSLERIAYRGPEVGPVRWREPVVLHPARQLPLAPRRSEGQIDAAVLRREVVHRPAEGERLDHRPLRQRLRELAGARRRAAGPDRKLGERLVHREHRAEPAYDARHRLGPDGVEQLSLHPPGQRLRPGDRGLARRAHARSLTDIPDERRPQIARGHVVLLSPTSSPLTRQSRAATAVS